MSLIVSSTTHWTVSQSFSLALRHSRATGIFYVHSSAETVSPATYTCVNLFADVEVTVDLSSDNITNGSVIQGNVVVLTCTATNPPDVSPPLTISWFKGDKKIQPDDSRLERVNNTLTLTIRDIRDTAEDEGVYLCEAYNREPSDAVKESINVNVICEFSLFLA